MSTNLNMGELLNLVGLSAGVVLYAMLLAMVLRAGRGGVVQSRVDPLLLLTSVLGLAWNLCALPVYELPKIGINGPLPVLAAVGFAALGFLPAVVVHSVLRGERDGLRGPARRALAVVAYSVSGVAMLLQAQATWIGSLVPSPLAMRLLTYTFVALVVPVLAVTRGQPGARRALWAAALAIFAVSALHLSQLEQDQGNPSWVVELVGHHASLPLAIAILYQDYPFAFADLFLKRALALLAIVTIPFLAIAALGTRSPAFAHFVQSEPWQVGALVTLWVATVLLYPVLRRMTVWFVDAIVLHRPDYPSLRTSIGRDIQRHDDVEPLLSVVCERLVPAFSSRSVTWQQWLPDRQDIRDADALGTLVVSGTQAAALAPQSPFVTAIARVPTSELPRYMIAVGQLTGGRRFLSDDLAALEAVSVMVARRIDTIRITHERYESEIREGQIGKLASEAELRALRAQINPHFLFNALTTIGYLIQTAPPRALQTLMRLTALLRSVLRSDGELTTLGRELDVVEAYLEIEHARFEERLRFTIDVPASLRSIRVPPFVLQPIVENAVKHGIAEKQAGGEVFVRAAFISGQLSLTVRDTGAGATPTELERGQASGLGLRNIERRLAFQYGHAASVTIHSTRDAGTTVEVRLPLDPSAIDGPSPQRAAG